MVAELEIQTEFWPFQLVSFEDHVNRTVHLALVRGELDAQTPVLVRVHIQDTLSDVVGVLDSRLGWPLRDAMKLIAAEDRGVIIILRQDEPPREFMNVLRGLEQPENEIMTSRDGATELRTYGTGAQILRALGVKRMRVLSAPKQMHALSGFGLEVVEYVSSDGGTSD